MAIPILKQKADILLINCPHWNVFFPPPGILHVHEALKQAGFSSAFFDTNSFLHKHFELYLGDSPSASDVSEHYQLWNSHRAFQWKADDFIVRFRPAIESFVSTVVAASPKVLGFSVSVFSRAFSVALAGAIKERLPEVPIVFGGFECLYPELLPQYSNAPDYYVVGEAEEIAPRLLAAILSGASKAEIYSMHGVMVNDQTGFESFQPARPPQTLDRIIYPQYDDVDLEDYKVSGGKYILVGTSRGCNWGRCAFCSLPGAFRERSPEHVFGEIKYLYDKHGVNRFSFTDQDVNNSPKTLMRTCDLIISAGLGNKITLEGQLRISRESNSEFFVKMKRAGFSYLGFGVESGCNKVLRLMKKGITRELSAANLKAAKSQGLVVGINIIVGFPGETYEDFLDTLTWLVQTRGYYDALDSLAFAQILRSSYMFDRPHEYNLISDRMYNSETMYRDCYDWTTTNDPNNTRANRELRRAIVLDVLGSLGVNLGLTVQVYDQLAMDRMAEPERELLAFVQARMRAKLDLKGNTSTVNNKALQALVGVWKYSAWRMAWRWALVVIEKRVSKATLR